MRRGPLPLIALLAATSACGDADQPVRTLPDSTLIEVLMDLHLAGARLQVAPGDAPAGLRDSVLGLHGLDSASFLDAMAWYEAHPEEYVSVYGTVVDRLSAERDP